MDDRSSNDLLKNTENSDYAGEDVFVFPISYAQQRLWLLDQLEPGNPAYNRPAAVRLTGRLSVAALSESLNEVMLRHESLRTCFDEVDGELAQIVCQHQPLSLPVVDLSELHTRESEAEASACIKSEAKHHFDLRRSPLLRASLLRLSCEDHILLLVAHHAISDPWSDAILFREVAVFYQACLESREPSLPALGIQYADFADWQRRWLQGEVLKQQLSYWQEQLKGDLPALELPTDRPRPAVQTVRGRRHFLRVPDRLRDELKELCREEQVTLFMALLAAFKGLLHRYTGQQGIVVGSPVAGRNRPELENIIGFFVNTLVMRSEITGNLSLRQLLGKVRDTTLEAFSNQDLPFEKLVEVLRPERVLSHTPIFQVMFVLQNSPAADLKLPGLKLETINVDGEGSKFDMTLSMTDTPEHLVGSLEYNTDLFDAVTVERMMDHFENLLGGIVESPGRKLSELPLLTDLEREQIAAWNKTEVPYPHEACIHHLFQEQVERTPYDVAVEFEDDRLTYDELNRKSNQLARYLRANGVRPDALVAICLDRSIEMLVGLLAILKAGGAYLPLDPTYPPQRLQYMIEDAAAPVLLTSEKLAEALPAHGGTVIRIDTDWQAVASLSAETLVNETSPENLSYVIYTSGSTGGPKGVQISHRSVVSFLNSMRRKMEVVKQDTLLAVTTLSFDIAVLELFLPITTGARVVLVRREVVSDGTALAKQLVTSKATMMQATPATFRLLVEAGWQPGRKLKLLCGGENLDLQLARQLMARGGSVWNLYGPTETTIWSTAREIKATDDPITIGAPIDNTSVYLLDAYMQMVPIGVRGEIHIGGVGLSRGYLNRPDITAERFIPDPFSDKPGARMYKTGDMARYLPTNEIEFLRRMDQQVKIRGFRVEVEEIEQALCQHARVRQAAVIAQEDGSGAKRLVGYVVPAGELPVTVAELHIFLNARLPHYMIPSIFVTLEAMPLTPNGKLNRRALPAPDCARQEAKEGPVASGNATEEILVGIWSKVLGLRQVGIKEDFFELGGHSLLAAQVINQANRIFRIAIPLRELFNAPTIADLARHIESARSTGQGRQVPALRRIEQDREPVLSFAQQRLWFLDHLQPLSPLYNISSSVRIKGPLSAQALIGSLGETFRRHEVLRSRFYTVDGLPAQVIDDSGNLEVPIVELTELPETDREGHALRLATEYVRQPFDLAGDQLLRATVLRLSDQDHVVLLVMHHIVSDGWSAGVLLREVVAFYESILDDKPSPLPDLPLQYSDYSRWQRLWLQGEVLQREIGYWKGQLSGKLPVLELPTDRPRPAVRAFRGARQSTALDEPLVAQLKSLSLTEGVTLFMTVLAAFKALLHRYTGQHDIIVASPVANREVEETENLIGFFANTLLLRTDLSGDPPFRELLWRVREVALNAYSHQSLPFEKLVEELHPKRHVSDTPLYQVIFVFQNTPTVEPEIQGLSFTQMQVESGTAKADLTLSVSETGQGLSAIVEYDAELFNPATINRFIGHFKTLLESVVENPDQPLSAITLLTPAEQLLLEGWEDIDLAHIEGGAQEMLARLDQLSDDEVDSLLSDLGI